MPMDQAIRDFPNQFAFIPTVARLDELLPRRRFLVLGMGGSGLAPDLFRAWNPAIDLLVHRDYGLPERSDLADRLTIACSYSGSTEEVLDGYRCARASGLPIVVITTGGTLLALAQGDGVSAIALPDTGIQPRSALGFSAVALAEFCGLRDALAELRTLPTLLDSDAAERVGARIAERAAGHIPLFIASTRNAAVAYNWKIKWNETGKMSAFMNVIPELNHNEMSGFDGADAQRPMTDIFRCIMLTDAEDDPRIQRRMEVTAALYRERGMAVEALPIEGTTRWHRIFSSLLIADWAAFHTAMSNGAEPEHVPVVEEFKRRIAV